MKKKIFTAILFVCTFVFASASASAASVDFEENFDSYLPGNPLPVEWTTTASVLADVSVENADPTYGNALEIFVIPDEIISGATAARDVTVAGPYTTFEFDVKASVPGATDAFGYIVLAANTYDVVISLNFVTGEVFAFDVSAPRMVGNMSPTGYTHIRVEIDYILATYDVYVNGVMHPAADGIVPFDTGGPFSRLSIYADIFNFEGSLVMDVDNILITSNTGEPAPNPRTGDSTSYSILAVILVLVMIAGGVLTRKFVIKK